MDAINRKFFFDRIRERPFSGSLSQGQADGITAILDYWEAGYPDGDDRWLAYILGTAFRETARRMQPIHEFGSDERFERLYEGRRDLGNDRPGDGVRYHGRGFVQLTGRRNYTDWSNRLGLGLVGNPDLALDLAIATRILVDGSVLGTFTGVRLANYFSASESDWKNARRIINGNDRDEDIAVLAKQFWAAISHERAGRSSQAPHRPVLVEGARGEDVRFLQQLLSLQEDGSFGPMTRHVVEAFQANKGLVADGVAGPMTWRALLAPPQPALAAAPVPPRRPVLRFGSRGSDVMFLQQKLGIHGDGDFGPNTFAAVVRFQEREGLMADGIVGPATWAALG